MNIYTGEQQQAQQESCMISTLRDTDARAVFHPVLIFPNADYDLHGGDYEVVDMSRGIPDVIASALEAAQIKKANHHHYNNKCRGIKRLLNICGNHNNNENGDDNDDDDDDEKGESAASDFPYTVGKYNERRANIYTTDLFHNTTNTIDGYSGERDVHIGVDLGGPLGSTVYAFADGLVHSAGYNSALGDYGYVVVLEHDLSSLVSAHATCSSSSISGGEPNTNTKLYALYGHLGKKKVKQMRPGQRVEKGSVIGYLGDVTENGGWPPHVHFQLSIHAPETHDMPGVVSNVDREKSLVDYPDPRLVLGELYVDEDDVFDVLSSIRKKLFQYFLNYK